MSWQGAGAGAASGAATGSMFGPWGTAIGAGVGALTGALGSRKKKNKTDDVIQQMLAMQMQQYQQQQPLRDAVQSMAMNRLRAVYPNGVPGMPQNTMPPTQWPAGTDPLQRLLQMMTQRG